MKKIENISEIQQISLRGLQTFDAFCKAHDIKYSLAGGTMIGAVRHKGFIPWDDDVDLFMRREEYEKLSALVKGGECLADTEFEFFLPGKENYIYPFIKIVHKKTIVYEKNINKKYAIGVWLDIFPIDDCGNSFEEAERIRKAMRKNLIGTMRSAAAYEDKTIVSTLKNAYVWCFRNIFHNNYEKFVQKTLNFPFPKQNSLYVENAVWPYIQGKMRCGIYPAEWFDEYEEIVFEQNKFMIFKRYKEILERRYGNYMQLPPEEERVGHEFSAYYRA